MRLNSDCCGVMDNACFHYGPSTSLCGQDSIFNNILTLESNTGKNYQRGGLLGPDCENQKNLPMIRETWKTFQRGGLLRPKKVKKKKKKKKKRKEKILLRIREPFTMLTLSYTKLLSKVHLSMKSSWTSNEQDKLAGTNHPY